MPKCSLLIHLIDTPLVDTILITRPIYPDAESQILYISNNRCNV